MEAELHSTAISSGSRCLPWTAQAKEGGQSAAQEQRSFVPPPELIFTSAPILPCIESPSSMCYFSSAQLGSGSAGCPAPTAPDARSSLTHFWALQLGRNAGHSQTNTAAQGELPIAWDTALGAHSSQPLLEGRVLIPMRFSHIFQSLQSTIMQLEFLLYQII